MNQILIQNPRSIVTCDDQDTLLEGCDLLIEGREIVKMAPNISPAGCHVIDATGKIVYPGLINTHHHLFQSFVRNQKTIDCPNLSLIEWLTKIYQIFENLNSDAIYYASLVSMADLIKHGCTTVFDHQYCYTPFTGKDPIDRQMVAAEMLGVRFHAGRGTNTMPKEEGSTIPAGMVETTEEFIADARRLIDTYHDSSRYSMRQIAVAPCQPVNCYEETFVEAVKLAREKGVRLHTHLAEGENALMVERYGISSLEWCKKVGFVGEDVWFAHCWDLTDEELVELAKTKSGISHCSSGATLGGFPILKMKLINQLGIPVGLGVDGSATNDGSSLLDAIRIAYLMQAHFSRERGGCISSYDVLKMATRGSAKVLGRDDIGSLEVGKAADLFLLDVSPLDMVGTDHDPQNLIGRVGATNNVYLTMVNGKVVYQNNRLVGIDEEALAKEAEALCAEMLQKGLR